MGLLDGLLLKMLILSYDNEDYAGIPIPFPVMYNPTSFTQTFTTEYVKDEKVGANGQNLKYVRTPSGDVSFDFLFDATGASDQGIQAKAAELLGGVDVQILLFRELTQGIVGDKHRPRYLQIVWGTFIFSCQLTKMDIKYELFAPSGRPLRAVVTCTFTEHKGNLIDGLLKGLSSPDLTHTRLTKAGETLHGIAKEVYGDPRYYTEIARVNKLKNFRKLKQGHKLILPPIDKTTSSKSSS